MRQALAELRYANRPLYGQCPVCRCLLNDHFLDAMLEKLPNDDFSLKVAWILKARPRVNMAGASSGIP